MKKNKEETITIRELPLQEKNLLLAEKTFNKLKPDNCSQCEEKKSFRRRIFEITGVAINKQNDDETQNFLRYHFKHKHYVDFLFFKGHKEQFYVDTAVCEKCKSTAVVFDIDLFDQDLIFKTSKISGKSETQIKNELRKVHDLLTKKKA